MYDWLMKDTEEAGLGLWRRDLLEKASGKVLEIGGGTGVNLAHYPSHIETCTITEPDPFMRQQLEKKFAQSAKGGFRTSPAPAQSLPFEDATFDTVVSTLVLCTVENPSAAMQEVVRVLRKGGQFLFIEHVHATDNPKRAKWQSRLEPIWKCVAGGCHLTRDTLSTIEQAGLQVEEMTRASLRRAPPVVRPTIRGMARK